MKPWIHVLTAFGAAVTLISIWSFQISRRLRRVMARLDQESGTGT